MKVVFFLGIFTFFSTLFLSQIKGQNTHEKLNIKQYNIIKQLKIVTEKNVAEKNKIKIYQKDIDKLNEPLKAIAAYYCALMSSNCFDSIHQQFCELTTALGLGSQGSEKHIKLLRKWFTNDEFVQRLIKDSCLVMAPGATIFNDYRYLIFNVRHDTVVINYGFDNYNHGVNRFFKRKDVIVVTRDQLIFIERN
jgi:hypothetical protein